jgi:hypothetical protein
VKLEEAGMNRVKVTGGTGKEKPATYKVSVGYQAFYLGEGEITYGGPNATNRAKLAGEIVHKRLASSFPEIRVDLIGQNSVHGDTISVPSQPYEVRLRVAGKSSAASQAALIGEEVEALYTNGPGGGGGVRKNVTEVIGIVSTFIPRSNVHHRVTTFES